MQALAGGGSGGSDASGSGGSRTGGAGSGSHGASAGYSAKVAARVRPNIVYPDAISGNPQAVVRVRAAPDGTITSAVISKSSGNKAWDDAVVRALEKTDKLPRDIDGRVPSPIVIQFRPRD